MYDENGCDTDSIAVFFLEGNRMPNIEKEVKVKRKGFGDTSTFAGFHPVAGLMYYVLVIGITMFSMSPFFLGLSFAMGLTYSYLLRGTQIAKQNIMIAIATLIAMTILNTLFTHNGETVLFYINGNRITLEAMIYGIAAAVMISAVIIWFSSFNAVMTSDKIIFLFGKSAPVFGLIISMIFRFIPLLKKRFEEISMGQKCMGRQMEKGPVKKVKQLTKEVSILTAWSLEASIESADSMAARGYGLRGRTSFHLFKIVGRDIGLMVFMAVTGAIAIFGCAKGYTTMYYYPKVEGALPGPGGIITIAAFAALMSAPIIIDIYGEYRWQRLK